MLATGLQRFGVIASSGGSIPLVDGKFVIIASGASSNSNRLNYSSDGKTWFLGSISDRDWRSVCFDSFNKRFIVSGNSIAFSAYSSDGINFTTVSHGVSYITAAVNTTGTSILVGTNTAAYSTNGGASWTTTTIPAGTYYAAEWSPYYGKFYAMATNGARVTSPDGITWTSQTSTSAVSWVNLDTNESGRMVAIAFSNPTYITTSDDGTTWSAATSAGIDANGTAMKWLPAPRSHWVAGSHSTQGLYTSATGAAGTFTRKTGFGASAFGVAYSPELNILVSANYQGIPQYSTDNASAVWTNSNASSNLWQDIAWGNFA